MTKRSLAIRRFGRRAPFVPRDLGPRRNERIRIPEVRVIDSEGKQLGIMPTRDALALAREAGMDLVEVAPNAVPPVCRILDYGKYKYEEAKKQRETKRNATPSEVKGVRMRYGTEAHDLEHRARDARRFLEEGHKVMVTLQMRGREQAHPEIAEAQLEKLRSAVSDLAVVERPPVREGRRLTMLLAPK